MKLWLVDAFTNGPFRGGPAYVVEPMADWPSDGWMQTLAMELAQPETAFIRRTGDKLRFGIRWFTPAAEAPLCGHATLAAAHVLFREAADAPLRFECGIGELQVHRAGEGYRLDFPSDEPRPIDTPAGLLEVLGSPPQEVWAGRQYLCAVLASEAAVRALKPSGEALAAMSRDHGCEAGSLIVTAPADPGQSYDVVSRFFAPLFGIPEDPVTGSAHTMLMPLYARRTGARRLRFHQACPGRGGDLECELRGGRVLLTGGATTILAGRLALEAEPDCGISAVGRSADAVRSDRDMNGDPSRA